MSLPRRWQGGFSGAQLYHVGRFPGQGIAPGLHKRPAPVEYVTSLVNSLDAAYRVAQGHFRNVRRFAGIRAPLPERASQAMRNELESGLPDKF